MGGEREVQKFTKSFTFEVKSLNLKKYNAFAIITKSSVIKFHISTKHILSLLYNLKRMFNMKDFLSISLSIAIYIVWFNLPAKNITQLLECIIICVKSV